mmetsp:Transcript_18191/g.48324  ORF Transcript_18191/g.48324 Transcript_18191/m.48324 type:complete len:276 (+) Transcript_18191:671-1498(+)
MMRENAARGLPGMTMSVDCMHWQWKNCPTQWAGQFQGKAKVPTTVLEGAASFDTRIWYCFLGIAGSNNDINIIDRSPLIEALASGKSKVFPNMHYNVGSEQVTQPYMLADGKYPSWACFVKGFATPFNRAESNFTKNQEAVRKDIERAFGILQVRFPVVARPARHWFLGKVKEVIIACIILHNVIVEDERETCNSVQGLDVEAIVSGYDHVGEDNSAYRARHVAQFGDLKIIEALAENERATAQGGNPNELALMRFLGCWGGQQCLPCSACRAIW